MGSGLAKNGERRKRQGYALRLRSGTGILLRAVTLRWTQDGLTVGICLHRPIVKELEKLGFSDWKKGQKRVRQFAQKGCLTKDSMILKCQLETTYDKRRKR